MPESSFLLDTHVWLWLMNGQADRLSRRCVDALRKASLGGRIWISAISVWEVATLTAKGRVTLSTDCMEWVELALRAPGVNLAPLTARIAVESARLPGSLGGDPADRILVATARSSSSLLVTRDRALLTYAGDGHVNAMDASA